jgi:ABC-type nitrate/sulfonate/bicarbonate transport system substrate-binding protein
MTAFTRSHALQALAGAVVAPSLVARAAAQTPSAIRLGIIPIEPTCLAYYAKENGFFEKAGLDVDIIPSASTGAIASAVVSGTYDIAYSTVSTLATAHARGLPFTIIAPAGVINGSKAIGGIVVGMNSTIATPKDLNGKTFGTSGLNTLAEYLPRAWVDKNGGDSTTMKFVEIPFPQIADAIAAGRIDAGYLVEPFIILAKRHGTARFLATGDDAIAPVYLASAWYTTATWAKEHPEIVGRFVAAMADAGRWANANPAKVIPIIANHLKADPAITAAAPRTEFTDRLVAAQIQPWIDVTAKYAKFPSFPSTELVYHAT